MGTPVVPVDACMFTSTTVGTGTYSLGNAVGGYFHPSDFSPSLSGSRVSYTAVDSLTAPTVREIGEGILTTGSPWTLSRAEIVMTVSGGVAGSSAISWPVGTRYIFITSLARNQLQLQDWRYVDSVGILSSTATATLTIPSWLNRGRIEWSNAKPASGSAWLYARFSTDGGATYVSTGYTGGMHDAHGATGIANFDMPTNYLEMSPSIASTSYCDGMIEFGRRSGMPMEFDSWGVDTTAIYRRSGYGALSGATATHIQFRFVASGPVDVNIGVGTFTLHGRN